MPTNPAPAARLAAALETYWPEGCQMFFKIDETMMFDLCMIGRPEPIESICSFGEPAIGWVATIAAVAAAHFAAQCLNGWTLELSRATDTFQKIYEAATEAEQ